MKCAFPSLKIEAPASAKTMGLTYEVHWAYIPEGNTLHKYLASGLGISDYLECTACFSAKVSKIPYVEFIYGTCLFLEKKSVFFLNFLYHLVFVI
jgi:hypothetical protein